MLLRSAMLARVGGRLGFAWAALGFFLHAAPAYASEITVCVSVRTRSWSSSDDESAPQGKPARERPGSPAEPGPKKPAPKTQILPPASGASGPPSSAGNMRENLAAAPPDAEPQPSENGPILPLAEPEPTTTKPTLPTPSVTTDVASTPEPPPRPAFDEAAYLTRMFEYEVTHEVGFAAVKKGCKQHLDVELYPLPGGWTVFARYSGNQREEKVDSVSVDELGVLARRLTRALLRDVPVNETITRSSVLKADTEQKLRKIGVQGHVLFGLGSALRFGLLPNAQTDSDAPQAEERFFTPATIMLGYRGKFQEWGLDAFLRGNLGITERTPNANRPGGHVDYAGGLSLGLHFLHYFDPDGITSLYAGGGASFELTFLTMIRPEDRRTESDRDTLVSGGLNVDAVAGYEFMRASAIHFFAQLELNVPTYGIRFERTWGVVDTYLPGAVAHIGVIF